MNPSNGSRFALDRVADEAPPPDWLPPESQRHPTVYPGSDLHERPGRRTRRIRLLTLDDLDKLPRLEWLVGKLVPARGLVVLYGPPGSGKTFVVLDLVLSIAAGVEFHGLPVRRGPAVYVAGEGLDCLSDRVAAWRSGREKADLDLHAVRFVRGAVNLFEPPDVDALLAALDRLPERPALVVFDSLTPCSVAANLDATRDMGVVCQACGRIQERGAAVLLVHHGTKATGVLRNSSVLPAAADSILAVSKTGSRVRVRPTKLRDAPLGTGLDLRLEAVNCDGRLVSWQLRTRDTEPDDSAEHVEARDSPERKVLAALADGAWHSLRHVRETAGLRHDTVPEVLARLRDSGSVEEDSGRWRLLPGDDS